MLKVKMEQLVKVIVTHDLGTDCLDVLALENYQRPMIVLTDRILENPQVTHLLDNLKQKGINFFLYHQILSEPTVELIDNGASLYHDNRCDCLIAIGGGSIIDAARGINIVRKFKGSIKDYVTDKIVPEVCEGLIAVPTTAGTGSELSNALVVTDSKTKKKLAVLANEAVSQYALLVPELTMTMPKNLTIMTGLDAFSHAAEAYTSNLASPVIDAICEKIMTMIVKYLPEATTNPQNLIAREKMMSAAALGGCVLNNGGTHLGHSLAHVVGAKFGIPHGCACAYALPVTLELTAKVLPEKVREIGNILGESIDETLTSEQLGTQVATSYKKFRDETLGLTPFSEFGISPENIQSLAEDVVSERFAGNSPFIVTKEIATEALCKFG